MEVNLSIHVPKQVRTTPAQVHPSPNTLVNDSDSNSNDQQQLSLGGPVSPGQTQLRKRVAPQQTQLRGRVAPQQTQLRDRVAPQQTQLRGRVAPQQAELRGRVAPQQAELRGRVAPQQAELRGHVAPQQAELRGRVAPQQAELRGRVAPQQTELRGSIAPQQTELPGNVAPPLPTEYRGRDASLQTGVAGRDIPAKADLRERVVPLQTVHRGYVAPAETEAQVRIASVQHANKGNRYTGDDNRTVVGEGRFSELPRRDQREQITYSGEHRVNRNVAGAFTYQHFHQGPSERRPVFVTPSSQRKVIPGDVYPFGGQVIREHPDSVNGYTSLRDQPSESHSTDTQNTGGGFGSTRNQGNRVIKRGGYPVDESRYQVVVESDYQYLKYEGGSNKEQLSYAAVNHRVESGYGSLKNQGVSSSQSNTSYSASQSETVQNPQPGARLTTSLPSTDKVAPKYQNFNSTFIKTEVNDNHQTVGYSRRQEQHVSGVRSNSDHGQSTTHEGNLAGRSRERSPHKRVRPRHEHVVTKPVRHRGTTAVDASEVTAEGRRGKGKGGTKNNYNDYLDVNRMADLAGSQYGDRAQFIEQIQQNQIERSRSPPYPLYDFKKPEELHPDDPLTRTKDLPQGQGPGGGYGSSSGYDSQDKGQSHSGFHAKDGVSDDPGSEFFLSQRNMEPYGANGSAKQDREGGGGGRGGVGGNYHSRNESLTDDEKINGTDRTREGDDSDVEAERGLDILRQLHEREEAARRLQEEEEDDEDDTARQSPDVVHPKKKPRGGYRPPPPLHLEEGDDSEEEDSGSETPTNRSSQNYTNTYRPDGAPSHEQADPGDFYYRPPPPPRPQRANARGRARPSDRNAKRSKPGRQRPRQRGSDPDQVSGEDGEEDMGTPTNGEYYYSPQENPDPPREQRRAANRGRRKPNPQPRRGSSDREEEEEDDRGGDRSAAPAGDPTYYSLSRRNYFPLQVSSEPSYSRDPSPGSVHLHHHYKPHNGGLDVGRSQSEQDGDYALRMVYDSNDTSGRTSSVDESWVSFDRYARRAVRAQVLGKAEQLLHERRHKELSSIREVSGMGASRRGKKAGSLGTGRGRGGRGASTGTRLPLRRRQPEQQRPSRKVAFMADNEEDDWIDPDGDSHFQEALESFRLGGPGEEDLEMARRNRLRGLNTRLKRRKAPHRWGANPRRKNGGQSPSEYDQFSTGSEEDLSRYGQGQGDLARYEMHAPPRLQGYGPATDRSDVELTQRKARRVWFFRNGDQDFKAKLVLVSHKAYPSFQTLLDALAQEVPTVSGVKHIFSWPDGREVHSVLELQNGCYYVCSSVNRLTRVNYGSNREQFWHGGRMKHDETHLFNPSNGVSGPPPNSHAKPLVITVISNLYRDSHEKVILNPNTTQNFEELLADMQYMVNIPHPPVRSLYTETKPHIKVEGFNQLFRELKDQKNFLVCGEESVPVEPKKRPLPSSNSSNDSLGKRSQRISKQARADGRSSDSVSPNRRLATRRTEPVRCEINGRKREFFAPSMPFLDSDGARPEKKLQLEWVYGFRGRDVKQNLVLLPNTGELVYFVAAVIVLYDRKTHTQKHYLGHTEEVTCITLHPRYPYIASGQVSGRTPEGAAHIRVWCGLTLSTFAVIGIGEFRHGICCLSFSESETNGDLLLAVDDSNRHVMSVWEWTREDRDKPCACTTLLTYTRSTVHSKTTNEPVVYGCFYPFDDKILVTFGKQHMYFWTVFWNRDDGKILRDKKSGVFEDTAPKFVTTVCFSANRDVITGDSTGSILVWSPDDDDIFRIHKQKSQAMKFAHKNNVSSLVMLSDGALLSSGGSEIKAWDSLMGYKLLKERVLPEVYGAIRKIVPVSTNGIDGYLFVGTGKNIILEGSMQSKFRPLVQGHSEELWAVKAHPTEHSFFTAGHDGTLLKWSADDHRLIWSAKDKKPMTSIAVDPLGQLVAVGTTSGKVSLYGCGDADNRERKNFQVGQAQINTMSFSPDGSQLAVGSHDGFIHIYVIHEDGQVFKQQSAVLRNNGTFVMHLDWSSDCRYIQSLLGDYELIFWDVHNMQKLKTGRTLRDVNWASFCCPVGYPLIGAWQAMEKGEVINVACRSKYLDYILTGDSKGRIRLYKYPSTQPKAEYRQMKPFSSNTTAAEFLSDGSGVLVTGGNDAALMQFAVRDK